MVVRSKTAFVAAAVCLMLPYGCRGRFPTAASREAPALFRDVAAQAGLSYKWSIPGKRPLNILQTIGNGCAFLDYNQDGALDILLVGPRVALYQGDGRGRFKDVTRQAGLETLKGSFLGCAVGDYDNDGFPDIYLTAYRGGALLHNEPAPGGSRMFRDVTRQAGLAKQPWSTSASFVQLDPESGRLDLVIANYARFNHSSAIPQLCEQKSLKGLSLLTSCGPRHYTPLKAVLYRNIGSGRFAPAETLSQASGRGLGVAACDYDNIGSQSLAFANDETTGDLLQNGPHGRLNNVGAISGTAYDRDGNIHGGMGLDWGDYDNDGREDLLVTTFQNEPKCLYHNEGGGNFVDSSYPSGLGTAAYSNVAFGCKFLDYDNDGLLDIAIANGHVQDNIAQIDSSTTYRQTMQLFHSHQAAAGGAVTFQEVSGVAGPDFQRPIVGRGLAAGDFDNDGGIDLLVVDSEGAPLLLHNECIGRGHWLGVRLRGVKCNRDGYGSILTLKGPGFTLTRLCHADGSYMSSSDPRVLFGLGAHTDPSELRIKWPDGHEDTIRDMRLDRYSEIVEGGQQIPMERNVAR
ncbi:MAG TPA: CRTAC1 family protein [Chthonomonadales bacterium]|nr:CRTAC1 family protein [Chthonomonadales bacterium]